jgi:gluconate 5-dehydrogenase
MADIEDSAAPGPVIVARRVLLTGGTGGLGLAMASALAHAGASVVLTGRDADRAGQVAATLPNASGLGLDTRDEVAVHAAVRDAAERLGGIDLLVNNAGLGMRTVNPRFISEPQGFWTVSPEGFRAVVGTNLTGYFLVAREVTPLMLAAGHGRIVNISMNHATMIRRGGAGPGPARSGDHGAADRLAGLGRRGRHQQRADRGHRVRRLAPATRPAALTRAGDAAVRAACGAGAGRAGWPGP